MCTFVLYILMYVFIYFLLYMPTGSCFFRRHAFEQFTIPGIFPDSFNTQGVDGWVPPQLDLACPPKTSSSSHGFLKFLLVGVAFSGCVYMGKKRKWWLVQLDQSLHGLYTRSCPGEKHWPRGSSNRTARSRRATLSCAVFGAILVAAMAQHGLVWVFSMPNSGIQW